MLPTASVPEPTPLFVTERGYSFSSSLKKRTALKLCKYTLMVVQDFVAFCQETTIHGLNHVTGISSLLQRLLWGGILVTSFFYAGTMLKSAIDGKYLSFG